MLVNMRSITLVVGLFAVFVILAIPYNDAVIFKLTNAVCKSYNESWIVINKCRLKALRRDRIAFYFNGTVKHPTYDVTVHMQIFKRANGYHPWLINFDLDCCRFLKKPYNPTAMVIIKLFLDFTNFNHTCPYVGPKIVDGAYMRPELLRLPVPTGDYKLTMRWSYHKRLTFDTNVSFQFVENIIDQ